MAQPTFIPQDALTASSTSQKEDGQSDHDYYKEEEPGASYMTAKDLSSSTSHQDTRYGSLSADAVTPGALNTPGSIGDSSITPGLLSRSASFSSASLAHDGEDLDQIPPLDRLTVFDFLENLALPQRLERLQNSISAQTEKVRRQQKKLKTTSKEAQRRVVDEWRKRVPTPDEQLVKYRKRIKDSVDRVGKGWKDTQSVTGREKTSFIAGVLNIFISGYLVGAFPQYFHLWYTAQFAYFYPVRYYTYHKRGYHYFLADLCYFVNLLLVLSIWAFPQSRRLFISTFCLAFGNNAVAIAMWRNSLVFHSLDKVTSLFIHIMPCVTLHCLVHLIPASLQESRFPAIHYLKTSTGTRPELNFLAYMAVWASVPYAMWQLSYHLMISVRRREKINAGRPTSFTWLRKSYGNTWIGKIVLARDERLQEPTFMLIQYSYALLTMIPAPIWFTYRWASAAFLMIVFTWSVYNGATYYIDIFGKRFQKELEQLKADVAKWQTSPEIAARTPQHGAKASYDGADGEVKMQELSLGESASGPPEEKRDSGIGDGEQGKSSSIEAATESPNATRERQSY